MSVAQSLQISSPAPGAVVAPGTRFAVTVNVAAGTTFDEVGIVSNNLPESAALSSPPYQFSLVAPGGGLTGPLTLTAVGLNGSNPVFSTTVTINVEEPGANLTSLVVSPLLMSFWYVGQQMPLIVAGKYADGTITDLAASPQTVYMSGNSAIVQVNSVGLVTAIGSGNTSVNVAYGGKTASVNVSVPNSTRGDLNGDGRVDTDDLNLLDSFLNTPANGSDDARDLNRDGVINALDARILVTLCTYPACATHH